MLEVQLLESEDTTIEAHISLEDEPEKPEAVEHSAIHSIEDRKPWR
jgi:hypothetical protein